MLKSKNKIQQIIGVRVNFPVGKKFGSFSEKARGFWQAVAAIKVVLATIVALVDDLQKKIKKAGRKQWLAKRFEDRIDNLRQASDLWYSVAASNIYHNFGVDLNLVNFMEADLEKIMSSKKLMEESCRRMIQRTRDQAKKEANEKARKSLKLADVTVIRNDVEIQAIFSQNGINVITKKEPAPVPVKKKN